MEYQRPEIEILELDMMDVIATSSGENTAPIPGENEGEILPVSNIPTI